MPFLVHLGFRIPIYYSTSCYDEKLYNGKCTSLASLAIPLIAVIYPSLQDLVRIYSKMKRFRLNYLCCRFDWMDGQNNYIQTAKLASFLEIHMSSMCL